MASFTGYFNDAGAAGQAGYGLYNQIDRALHGDKRKVHFVSNNVTLVEFDVALNEGHQFAVAPTSFPVEAGYSISDHATVAPIQLNITGLIADYPVETKNSLINSGVSSLLTAATTPLGSVGVLAATVGYTTLLAQNTSLSRSAKIFNDLQRLAGIQTPQSQNATPQVFDVITRLRRYPSMIITQLQLNRDSTSGPTNMVFTVQLQQIQVAYAQQALIQTAIPAKASPKQSLGEGDSQSSYLSEQNAAGRAAAESLETGFTNTVLNLLPGTAQ